MRADTRADDRHLPPGSISAALRHDICHFQLPPPMPPPLKAASLSAARTTGSLDWHKRRAAARPAAHSRPRRQTNDWNGARVAAARARHMQAL